MSRGDNYADFILARLTEADLNGFGEGFEEAEELVDGLVTELEEEDHENLLSLGY